MPSDFSPLVSIIIPVYNGSDFLNEAIESALKQTYRNIEIIVINDGSSDEERTEAVAKKYEDKIIYISKLNGGVASALNTGIKAMKGDYFSWLSHDDVYFPNKIETQINSLTQLENKKTVIFSDFELVDKNTNHLVYITNKKRQIKNGLSAVLFQGLNGCAMLIPKICFDDFLFDEKLLSTQDNDLFFKIAKKYDFKYVPAIVVKYRFHANQGSRKITSHKEEANNLMIKFINNLSNDEVLSIDNSIVRFYIKVAVFYKFMGYNTAAKTVLSYHYKSLNNNIFQKIKCLPYYFSYLMSPYIQYLGLVFQQLTSPREWHGYIIILFATIRKRTK